MSKQHRGDQQPARRRLSPFVITIVAMGIVLIIGLAIGVANRPNNPGQTKQDMTNELFPDGTKATKFEPETAENASNTAVTDETKVAEPAKPATGKTTPPTSKEIAAAKAAGTRKATIVTNRGTIVAELYGKEAPLTVANFVKLANAKFYDGLTFHRVEPGFVIQGGDPDGNGMGGPGYGIKLEIAPKLRHVDGALAMARSSDPDSAGSQFYFTLAPQPSLDDQYAVFGKAIKGMDVIQKIAIGDTITSVTIE